MARRALAMVALLPIVLAAGCGSEKRTQTATSASTRATTTAPTTAATTPHERATKHHAKAVAHHSHKRHASAVNHTHHVTKPSSASPRRQTSHTSPTTTTTSTPSSTSSITLDLLGRSGDVTSGVCGAPHHYRTYRVGQVIGLAGQVKPIPSAIWKVKVKIKVCSGAQFNDFVKLEPTVDKHRGTFTGTFPAPAAGFYEARAELYVNDVQTVVSTDEHFKTH